MLAGLALAGCAGFEAPQGSTLAIPGLEYEAIERGAYRAYAASFSQAPFSNGPISVIAADQGDLRTYRLVPCQGGAAVCAGSAGGRVGQVERTLDYVIVRGLYNRTFWLSPGGDGALEGNGRTVPLAWD